MCFVHEMLNTLKRSEEFTLEEFEKIARNFPSLYQLTLTGGEPTMRRDLPQIVEVFHRTNKVQRVTIPTNGFYTDRVEALVARVMSTCPGLTLSINLSLDGIGEVHDMIRGLPKSFENLVKTYRRVDELRRQYPNLHLATASVVTRSNQDTIPALLEYVRDHFDIEAHGLMIARGDIPTEEGKAPADERFIELLRLHRSMSRSGGRVANAILDTFTESRIDTIRNRRMKDPCQAGRKLLIINERGKVFPCEILNVLAARGETDAPELGDFSYGNLRDVDFNVTALLESPRGRAIRQFIKDERCWCTFECAQINNFVLNPKAHVRTVSRVLMPRQA